MTQTASTASISSDRCRVRDWAVGSPLSDSDPRAVHCMDEPVRILVVDDDLQATDRMRTEMEGEAVQVLGARSGAEALTLLGGGLPYLVLLGEGLPDMDSRELCSRIKTGPEMADSLVVMVGPGQTAGEDLVPGLASAADGYLVRPIGDRELVVGLRPFLRILRLNRALCAQVERRRVLEESLREQEDRHRVLIERIGDVVWTLNPRTHRFLYVSPSVERLRGYSAEEVMARPIQSLLTPDTWLPLKRLIRRETAAFRSGETPPERGYTAEIELSRKGGGTVWTETVAHFAWDPRTGQPVVHGVTRDIGARKVAEAALAESQRRYNLLVDNLPGFTYRRRNDSDRTSDLVSPGCSALTGYSAEDLMALGGPWHARIVHLGDRDRAWGEVQAALKTHGSYELEYRIVTAFGEERWVWERGRGIYGVLGELVGLEGLVLDMDPGRRAESAVRELNAELERRVHERTVALEAANAELESFAFSVSHDLRAPLRAICGFAEILRRRYRDLLDGDGQRYLDNVAAAGARMGALIEDLLLYARTGRGSVRAVPVPLGPLVAELGAGYAERIAACGAELAVREPLATPRGDPTLIRQILSNLVDNALTYRCLQGTPRIELSAVAEEGEVVIRVIDNGIGIAPEDHRRVFEVFQRLHSQDAYPGTGIGLAIVSKAIHTMGGQVDLSSALGSGSTFSVRLPVA